MSLSSDVRARSRIAESASTPSRLARQAADRRQKGDGHRRRQGVERLDSGVDRVWPPPEMGRLGCGALLGRGVLAVITGDVEVRQVDERIPPVHLGQLE